MRWSLVCLFALIGLWITGVNYGCVYLWIVHRKHGSLTPLIGGVSGALALLLCPIPAVQRWAWLPLVLDLGCVYTLASFLYVVFILKGFRR